MLLALYGPLVDGHLVGGARGSHILSSVEVATMERDLEEEDILSVYCVRLCIAVAVGGGWASELLRKGRSEGGMGGVSV